jgi:MFS family permease
MEAFLSGVRLSKRNLAALAIPIFSFFTWSNILSYRILSYIVGESNEIFPILSGFLCFSVSFGLLLAYFFMQRVSKTSLIATWSMFSSVGTILITLIPNTTLRIVIFLLLGALFGIGLLALFALFWETTVPEERGRVSGLIGFISLLIYTLVYALVGNPDFFVTLILSIILNSATMAVRLLCPKRETIQSVRRDLERYTEKRTVLLYSIPWLVFSMINAILGKTISLYVSHQFDPNSVALLLTLQVVGGSIGALVGGLMADFVGRRRTLVTGLILYGISSAISGLAQSYEPFYLSYIGIGLTWGIFLTLYQLVVWGDLANTKTCFRMYSIGLVIFYFATGIGSLFGSQFSNIPLMGASIVSCLFIFLSNIPLLFAPELLTRDLSERIRLKSYISLVKRKMRRSSNQG